jgi:hypothetical protein
VTLQFQLFSCLCVSLILSACVKPTSSTHNKQQAAAAFQALASSAAADYAPDDVVQELTALEKVAQKNRLACMVAQRATTGGSALEVAFDNSQHAFFPVAVLKSRKT